MKNLMISLIVMVIFAMPGSSQNIFDELYSTDTISSILTTDIKFLTGKKHLEEYVPSTFEVGNKTYDVEIKTRGNARKSICFYPPFKIKFAKDLFGEDEPNSFKLVNSCRDNNASEQLLVKEYFIYKLYNIITPKSLKAVIMHTTYNDTKGKRKPFSRYALILEDEESFAKKFDGVIYEPKVTFSHRLDTLQLAIMTMFEYFVGNTDWAIGNQHNVFVVRHKEGMPFPVPYDFDYAGLVNADYAVPQANTPIKTVKTRFNRGRCMSEENMQIAADLFLSKKDEILEFTDNFPYFNKATKKETYSYLNAFFDDISKPKYAMRVFCKDCKPFK